MAAATAAAGPFSTATCTPEYFYLTAIIEFAGGSVIKDGTLFRTVVTHALNRLHGQVGAAIAVDVLQIDAGTGAAILRVHRDGMTQLQSSLTVLGEYDRRQCKCSVLKTTEFLTGMAVDSRAWQP